MSAGMSIYQYQYQYQYLEALLFPTIHIQTYMSWGLKEW